MADALSSLGSVLGKVYNSLPNIAPKEVEKVIVKEIEMMRHPSSAYFFVRVAGLSGALAVGLGAYGSHVFNTSEADPALKRTFEIANKYHFIHSVALLAVPLTRKPVLVGSLMSTGILLFSGSCYYHALSKSTAIRRVTPYGGFLLIFAWLSMLL